jgi:hypothetical protein
MSRPILLDSAAAAAPPAAPADGLPSNLHIAVTSRASTQPRLKERVEQKFFVRPDRMEVVMGLLFRTCRRDPVFPGGQVNSLYFDTYDLEEHRRSDAGDSNKDKIRIRWYGTEFDPHRRCTGFDEAAAEAAAAAGHPAAGLIGAQLPETIQVWLERKTRRGFSSTKQRLALDVPASALAFPALGRGIVPPGLLVETMARFGFFPPKARFCPVIAISYSRYRFVEPVTGFRVSLDWRIRSSLVMPGLGRGERGLELPGAIIEVKGSRFDVPPALRDLTNIGASWTRFSKYSSSIDSHAADLGTVSRTWPSGLMEREPGHIGWVPAPVETGETVTTDSEG